MQQESSSGRSSSLAFDWYHLGRARTLEEVEGLIDGLSSASINAYLAENPPKDFTVVTLGPQSLEVHKQPPVHGPAWERHPRRSGVGDMLTSIERCTTSDAERPAIAFPRRSVGTRIFLEFLGDKLDFPRPTYQTGWKSWPSATTMRIRRQSGFSCRPARATKTTRLPA